MSQCKCNPDNDNPHFSDKEIFEIALKARDFEIKMFWQRCNYFLLLNTSVGAAVGAMVVSESVTGKTLLFIIFCLCIIGMFVCLAWIKVGLGAKFWQSYWEQVLIDFQWKIGLSPSLPPSKKPCEEKDIFSIPEDDNHHIKRRVKASLGMLCEEKKKSGFGILSFMSLFIPFCHNTYYNKQVFGKPSVSHWMHRTACFFFLVWFLAFVVSLFYVPWRILFCWLPLPL